MARVLDFLAGLLFPRFQPPMGQWRTSKTILKKSGWEPTRK